MTTQQSQIETVKRIIAENKSLVARKKAIFEAGFTVREIAMGSGGCGQVKETKTEVRIQIESGHGRYNFLAVVSF